jgi:hypothetical protein
MRDDVFVSVHCRKCGRISVNRFRRIELRKLLADAAGIQLRCPFDNHSWTATSWEHREILRGLSETEAVAGKANIATRIDPHEGDEVLPEPPNSS